MGICTQQSPTVNRGLWGHWCRRRSPPSLVLLTFIFTFKVSPTAAQKVLDVERLRFDEEENLHVFLQVTSQLRLSQIPHCATHSCFPFD